MRCVFLHFSRLALVLALTSCQDKGKTVTEDDLLQGAAPSLGDYSAVYVLPESASLSAGRTTSFEILGLLPYGNSKVLNSDGQWSSSEPYVLEAIDGSPGRFRALKTGQATVTFVLEGVIKTAPVAIDDKTLDQIRLTESKLTIEVENIEGTVIEESFQQTLFGAYSDGTVLDLSKDAVWTCVDPKVVTCGSEGSFKAVGVGTSIVKAKVLEHEIEAVIEVVTNDAIFTGFEITPSPMIVEINTPKTLEVMARFSNGQSKNVTEDTTFTFSQPSFVDVQGTSTKTIAGVTKGVGTVLVQWARQSQNVDFVVIDPLATRLVIESPGKSFLLAQGEQERFYAKLHYADGTIEDVSSLVTFESSDTSTLNFEAGAATGTFRSLKTGRISLTATLGTISSTQFVTIRSPEVTGLELTTVATGTLALKLERTYVARLRYTDNSTTVVTNTAVWSLENGTGTASSASPGVIKGESVGTVRVKVAHAGLEAFQDLTVSAAVPLSLAILPLPSSGEILGARRADGMKQLSLNVTYSDGTQVDHTADASWSYVITGGTYTFAGYVTNTAGNKAKLYPIADGRFLVEATYGSLTVSRVVEVTP